MIEFCYKLHFPIFYTVVEHLYKMSRALGPYKCTTGIAATVPCSDLFQVFSRPVISLFRSSRHDRRAFSGSFFTPRNSCSHEEDPISCQFFFPAGSVFIMGITTVYYQVPLIKKRF